MNRPEGQVTIEKMSVACIRQHCLLSNLKTNVENHLIIIVSGIIALIFLFAAVVNGFSLGAFLGGNTFNAPNVIRNAFDLAYLITAIGIIVTTILGEKRSVSFMQIIGRVYILVWLIGLMRFGSHSYSEWTSLTNFVLGFIMAVVGSVLQDYRHDLLVAKLIVNQRHTSNYALMETIKNSNFRYSVQKKKNFCGEIYYREDVSDKNCIKGEFI